MNIPYNNLSAQNSSLEEEFIKATREIIRKSNFILGDEVQKFEENFANYCGSKYAISVGNGTDALILALRALGIKNGDNIITVSNSFIATVSSIVAVGARPIFSDVNYDLNINPKNIEKILNSIEVAAIIPVHLTGKPVNIPLIRKYSKNCPIIEDAAQAVGASIRGKRTGALGDIGCFSLHPLKNLSALGDGGIVTTNNKNIYEEIQILRNHGLQDRDTCKTPSINSRLDTLQAAYLNIKLKYLDTWIKRRVEIAGIYKKHLNKIIQIPEDDENSYQVFHTYIIKTPDREELKKYLFNNGVDTKIHYPIPAHLQPAYSYLGYKKGNLPNTEKLSKEILSLPIYPELKNEEIYYIINLIEKFYSKQK